MKESEDKSVNTRGITKSMKKGGHIVKKRRQFHKKEHILIKIGTQIIFLDKR